MKKALFISIISFGALLSSESSATRHAPGTLLGPNYKDLMHTHLWNKGYKDKAEGTVVKSHEVDAKKLARAATEKAKDPRALQHERYKSLQSLQPYARIKVASAPVERKKDSGIGKYKKFKGIDRLSLRARSRKATKSLSNK